MEKYNLGFISLALSFSEHCLFGKVTFLLTKWARLFKDYKKKYLILFYMICAKTLLLRCICKVERLFCQPNKKCPYWPVDVSNVFLPKSYGNDLGVTA